jgi:hypothetical protein
MVRPCFHVIVLACANVAPPRSRVHLDSSNTMCLPATASCIGAAPSAGVVTYNVSQTKRDVCFDDRPTGDMVTGSDRSVPGTGNMST